LDVVFDLLQQEDIISIVEKNIRPVRSAIIDVIIVIGKERDFSSSHESLPDLEKCVAPF
jgi:hypothetical protein